MYLDKVLKAFNEYDEVVTAAREMWDSTKKKLMEDYGNVGRIYSEKFEQGKKLYEETVEAAKRKGLAIVETEFERISEIVAEFITTPVPGDFIGTLEAVKATGKGITEAEIVAYLEKYKTNYTAYRSLAKCADELTGKRHYVVVYDAIKNDIADYYKLSKDFFTKYKGNGYMGALLMHKNSPLNAFDAALVDFMKKDVASYNKADQIQE